MKSEPTTRTFTAALHDRLAALDRAYVRLRAIHADLMHTNSESKDHKEAVEQWAAVNRALWRLKATWSDEL